MINFLTTEDAAYPPIISFETFQTKALRDFTTEEITEELRLRKKEAKLLDGLVLPDETGRE